MRTYWLHGRSRQVSQGSELRPSHPSEKGGGTMDLSDQCLTSYEIWWSDNMKSLPPNSLREKAFHGMEPGGIEPPTSCLQSRRSPN